MSTLLTDAALYVNNDLWPVVPNTLTFTEGQGEQEMKAASVGGGKTITVYAHDVETNFSTVSVELYTTIQTIEDTKAVKAN